MLYGYCKTEFPEEDELERELQKAQVFHDQIQDQMNSDRQAADFLQRAGQSLGSCISLLDRLTYGEGLPQTLSA